VTGETATVELEYKVEQGWLNKGGHLWLLADIRQISDSFQITAPERPGFVRAWATGGQSLRITCPGEGRPGELVRSLDLLPIIPEFFFLVEIMVKDRPLAAGDAIRFEIGGDTGWKIPRQTIAEFKFWTIVDSQSEWQFEPVDEKYHSFVSAPGAKALPEPAYTSISSLPGPPTRLDVVIPSDHRPATSIPLQIRLFDKFENPVRVQRNLVALPEVATERISENGMSIVSAGKTSSGIVRLEVTERTSGLKGLSNPSLVEDVSESEHIYWGILHGMFFNQRPLDYYFAYARDVAALDFCAGQHFSYEAVLPGVWTRTRETVSSYYNPGHFVTLLSLECDPGPCGHKIILYRDTDVPPLLAEQRPAVRSSSYQKRKLDPDTIRCDSVEELWQSLHALGDKRAMVTAHHTADWRYHDPILQRLGEIYSKWGTCEYPGNPLDIRPAIPPREYIQEPLRWGYRLGIIAGGDTHDSRPGNPAPEPFGLEFADGLTAVFAASLTREAIWDALWQRRTYGTTGARILLRFAVNGVDMGGEAPRCEPSTIKIEATGTTPIRLIELIRNSQVFHRWQECGESIHLEYLDRNPPPDLDLYYYVRLTQEDGQMAWSSPVWVAQAQST
jgi:hypothetical protein